MPQAAVDKLELFEQEILAKANAERDAILRETEEMKKQELDREEAKQLEELYRDIQAKTARIKLDHTKALSKERVRLKQELYAQRERYVTELLARVRAELVAFTKSPEYPAFLEAKVKKIASQGSLEGGILEVRSDDLAYGNRLKALCGCEVAANDAAVTIGGVILRGDARGICVNESLDAALESQRDWFYRNSGFQLAQV